MIELCGRYLFHDELHPETAALIDQLKMELQDEEFEKLSLKEVFPSQKTVVCIHQKKPVIMQWGYEKWDGKGRIINARSENLASSSFFNRQGKHRCIVLASGYFEWNAAKQKVFFSQKEPLYMAGIYNDQRQFAIITQAAIKPYDAIHSRMPLLLKQDQIEDYLNQKPIKKEAITLTMQLV